MNESSIAVTKGNLMGTRRCSRRDLGWAFVLSSGALHRVARAGLCLAIAMIASNGAAQTLEAPNTPVITAPRVREDAGVRFPEAALRDKVADRVTVELLLIVDESGHVREAEVLRPAGHGFDEAAVTAARKILFEPASRNGRPVAAKIKYRYVFEPPAPKLVGTVRDALSELPVAGATVSVKDSRAHTHTTLTAKDGAWSLEDLPPGKIHVRVTARAALPATTEETLKPGEETQITLRLAPDPNDTPQPKEETVIEVRGERPPREVSKRTLSRDELQHSAGTQGDALLAIQNLPGIARPPPFSGALVVRGSAPEDTLTYVDGTDVPLVYHFGGLSSVVPTELVDQIDFYPGNFSTRYGRAMGGIVETRLRPPRQTGYHWLLESSVLGARALVEGPLGKGFSFILSGQRSWLDLVITPLLKLQGEQQTAMPRWADYQVALNKDFGADASLRLLFFGSDDALEIVNPVANGIEPTFAGALGYHTAFWRVQALFEAQLTPQTRLELTAAYGFDGISVSLGNLLLDAKLRPLTARGELSHQVTRGFRANLGFDTRYEPYSYVLQLPPITRPGVPSGGPGQLPIRANGKHSSFQPGVYAELELSPWKGSRFVPGVRADYESGTERWDLAPRLNLRQDLSSGFPRTTLKAGAGRYFQPPSLLDRAPGIGQKGLISNRATHYEVGLEQELTQKLELSLSGFYKDFGHLVVPDALNAGSGAAYGVEWLLRYKADARFFGWISYTLSRSERRDLPSEPTRLHRYDQTHVLALLANYKLGRGWQLGARFRVTSGDLYTPMRTGAYDASVGHQLGVEDYPPFGERLRTFHQLDLRVEKAQVFRGWRLLYYLDVQNAYYAKNPLGGVAYNYNYTESADTVSLPILPIFGIRAEGL